MQEWNHEASTLLTALAARFLGMPPESLMNSPGLRALVGQQLGWLHPAPDWMKLTGLLVTKKWNQMLLPGTCPVDNVVLAITATDHGHADNMSGMVLDHLSAPIAAIDPSIVPEEGGPDPVDAPPVDPLHSEEKAETTTTTTDRDTDVVADPTQQIECATEDHNHIVVDPVAVEPPRKRQRRHKPPTVVTTELATPIHPEETIPLPDGIVTQPNTPVTQIPSELEGFATIDIPRIAPKKPRKKPRVKPLVVKDAPVPMESLLEDSTQVMPLDVPSSVAVDPLLSASSTDL